MKALILVAGIGRRLKATFSDPKCLLPIGGVSLIERYLRQLACHGVDEVTLVVGYRKERIIEKVCSLEGIPPVRFVDNPRYEQGSVLSLWSGRELLAGDILLMDGDVYFEPELLGRLCASPHPDVLPVDTTVRSTGEEYMAGIMEGRVVELGRQLKQSHPLTGEWVGFVRLSAPTTGRFWVLLEEFVASGQHDSGYELALERLVTEQPLPYEPVAGLRWVEIDFPEDVQRAEVLARQVQG